jgi:hypothetical protein
MSRTIAALLAGELDKSHTENSRLLQNSDRTKAAMEIMNRYCNAHPQSPSELWATRCPRYRAKNLNFSGNVFLQSREIEVSRNRMKAKDADISEGSRRELAPGVLKHATNVSWQRVCSNRPHMICGALMVQ